MPSSRTRLPASIRSQQILQAALFEFSVHGFSAARMDDIAHRSGLSKGGLYAHFPSKDAVFEALLGQPPPRPPGRWRETPLSDTPMAQVIETFVADMLGWLSDRTAMATLRLLIAESHREPTILVQWREQTMRPFVAEYQALFECCARQGVVAPGVDADWPAAALESQLNAVLGQILFGAATQTDSQAPLRRLLAQPLQAIGQSSAAPGHHPIVT